ncbi:hypothetical protein A2334_03090 [Candidatus Roizmanbacteria bacterium RIFOXYB2_FULL_38_10]|uniref:Uncharacterized protein n=1 Tax=Candidatus Roizmanbacteria bacterium RIFOXYD1_FULL_38_12 TaxID=1802093 RepID=A0A1F7L1Q0_9BACT|nr:MAG: hypothetical protein A3K47_04675 [Candidatus Roizmanbacteria bacterium RIFOXYA2_FULL_38_14]OGK64045.1 MAG: hypothetical protein A3K27_04675 [Candidatus Roizmanbacteria bacterium RIFOXYA1_FULL_37_12]OGK65891.1 MAG: hypothetical protein A3K38_04675 [Candidatus Roizmanbacteria bacterium RIFOXYB1_FULL_40_23]OGK68107.1 MAG: hypothetical protein A2334_03090 [Candidatus Roizmanbacteria bacterium RIFOXYB2_FULL_38_10]OGK70296.1 MAG: hypothetical protein A3K21_04680 [Candidatus Roizmanbacteria ba
MKHFFFFIIFCYIFLFISSHQIHAYTIGPVEDVTVSAYIGITPPPPTITPLIIPTPIQKPAEGRFSLFGYSSPGAKISINNPGMYSDTIADNKGYYEFRNFFSTFLIEDLCLTSQDQFGRVTMPLCIPPIPSEKDSSIGPIIMPPTLSLNNNNFFSGDQITASGQTVPSTNIELSMFTDETKTSLRSLFQDKDKPFSKKLFLAYLMFKKKLNPIPISYAASLPKKNIVVDNKGNFSLVLSSDDPQYYRTFAQTIFEKAFSQKSITLNYDIFPGWFILMKFILGFLLSLKSRLLEIVFLLQIFIIAYYLIHHHLQPYKIARKRALALIDHPLPMKIEGQLLLQEKELVLEEHAIEKYR